MSSTPGNAGGMKAHVPIEVLKRQLRCDVGLGASYAFLCEKVCAAGLTCIAS